jgi:hypothetical protein
MPVWLYLNDVHPDGRLLLQVDRSMDGMICLPPGEKEERDLSWLDHSWVEALSSDGKTVLFGGRARASGEGPRSAFYLRNTDGTPPVRLGEGASEGLSPDGQWVIATLALKEFSLVPTGAGSSRTLPRGPIVQFQEADWLDQGHLVLSGNEAGREARVYVQDVATGVIRAISPEGSALPQSGAATLDGKHVLARRGGHWALYPVGGGDPRPLPFLRRGDFPIQWSGDGRTLLTGRHGALPATDVYRVDVASGRQELVKTLSPPDPAGFEGIPRIVFTPDGRCYCYTYQQRLGTLFVAAGLK